MSTIPSKVPEKIAFSQAHNAPFAAHAVAIGTSTTTVTDLGGFIERGAGC